jgi:methanethiol S-methyltransferase
MRIFVLLYGLLGFAVGLGISTYQIAFVGNLFLSRTVDRGGSADSVWKALVINAVLISLFGLQHSMMSRPWFKDWWNRFIPKPVERSTYMVMVGVAYGLLFHLWQPIETVIWQVQSPALLGLLQIIFWSGWVLVLWSSHLISPLDVWGLKQTWCYLRGIPYETPTYRVSGPYKIMRHPIMLGLFMAFWAAPLMTVGHLLFAIGMTFYATMATIWEERDLIKTYPDYQEYRDKTPMILPRLWGKHRQGA